MSQIASTGIPLIQVHPVKVPLADNAAAKSHIAEVSASTVGLKDGAGVGFSDGHAVGDPLGTLDGFPLGAVEGAELG